MKRTALIFIILSALTTTAYANTWCSGRVSSVKLNTDYNNNITSFTVNNVVATLHQSFWQDAMIKNAINLMMTAQIAGKSVRYWGSDDCKIIMNRLELTEI